MLNLFLDCIMDWRWWRDGISFTLFMMVAILTLVLFGA